VEELEDLLPKLEKEVVKFNEREKQEVKEALNTIKSILPQWKKGTCKELVMS